jgi:putative hydrolase of the HAD superfamily
VVFDLFHTLTGLESRSSPLPATSALLGVARRDWNRALLEKSRWRLTGKERDALKIVRALAHMIDPGIPEAKIRTATETRIQRFRDSVCRIPRETVDTLVRLRSAGFRLGLISNADVSEVAAWSQSPLCGLFDAEVFSCYAGCVKPEPEIYLQCLKALVLKPADCLFVGDGGSGELEGAREVGMQPVFVSGIIAELWPEKIAARRAIVDHEIRTIREILDLVGLPGG